MNWKETLTKIGALWHHDGNKERPYALLTSGRISGDFADMSFAIAHPELIALAARSLTQQLLKSGGVPHNLIICGQQEGSTTLASRIAEELDRGFVYTTKVGEGTEKTMVLAERFAGIFPEDNPVVLVEDVTTTASTSEKSREALYRAGFKNVSPILLTIVDRTGGNNHYGFNVKSCVQIDDFTSWVEGENPYTPDGKELLPPVRAKTTAGRVAMRKKYT
jgi:orotate phosphoribosyltransferase